MNYKDLGLNKEDLKKMYYYLYLTRYTDERSLELYGQGKVAELPHSLQGEEAIFTGTGYHLKEEDYVLPSLRARGYFYIKGVSSKEMMAGMFGKETGPARGKNTSHHMGDMEKGIVSGTGVVGGSTPLAVGAALVQKLEDTGNVVLVSFGDGSTSQGDFHESLNLTSVWNLPIVFVCENNQWAMGTPIDKQMAVDKISIKAESYGMFGETVDGTNLLEVYEAGQRAFDRARNGEGPTLLECTCYRWGGHAAKDMDKYRDHEVVKEHMKNCPVDKFKNYLLGSGFSEDEIKGIEDEVVKEVEEAIEYAESSDYPSPDILESNVYADN